MRGDYTKGARRWLEASSKFHQQGSKFQLDGLALQGLRVDHVEIGLVRCSFLIPESLTDGDGNWHGGAMSVLIDSMAAGAASSYCGRNLATVDFTISYYSTAKVHEEVEIEANVVGEKGNLVSVVIDIKKKDSGVKVAVGKQWMNTFPIKTSQAAKSKL